MMWNGVIRSGLFIFALAGCVGSGVSPAADAPAQEKSRPASTDTAAERGGSAPDEAPNEERVRAADLPGHPSGAVGFIFGDDATKAESTCSGAGHGWKKVDGEIYHCDGLPDAPDLQGTVFVQTCGGQVCLLRVSLNPSDSGDAAWLALYDQVSQTLHDSHGEPWQGTHKLPVRCKGEELGSCLGSGEAELEATWQWPSGHKIELRMIPPATGRSIALRVTYSTEGS
jgi:hypothetical protein